MRTRQWLKLLFAGAFLAGAVSIVGAAKTVTMTEASADEICERAASPVMPAQCFAREQTHRVLGADSSAEKGDLIEQPKFVQRYLTVERRVDGILEFRRVERSTVE